MSLGRQEKPLGMAWARHSSSLSRAPVTRAQPGSDVLRGIGGILSARASSVRRIPIRGVESPTGREQRAGNGKVSSSLLLREAAKPLLRPATAEELFAAGELRQV